MLEKDLIKLINKIKCNPTETTNIEFKSAKNGTPLHLYDTLSSFSNTNGGIIIFGINEKENYNINGVENPDSLIKKVTEQCNQMEPLIRATFTIATIDNKIIVSCEIPELSYYEKPCYYKGKGKAKGSYIRVGDADMPMTDFEIYNYEVFKRKINNETRTIERINYNYIDENLLNAFIGKLILSKPNLRNINKKDLLVINGLSIDENPTLCNILLFGKYPQMISPLLNIVCTIPALDEYGIKNNKGVRFIDNKTMDGTLVDMVNDTLAFINKNMKRKTIINKLGKREDESEYPLLAIREAILNAVIHRDYSIYTENMPITVTMYNNRIEIENPGNLYGGSNIEDLGKKRIDIRNPFIASNMEILMETENRHSGIPTMYEEMKKAGLLPPLFENKRDSFKVTFYNIKNDSIYDEINKQEIINYCSKPRSKKELAEHFGFDKDRPTFFINTYIVPLIEQGLLKYTIPNKIKSKNQQIVVIDYNI